MASGDKSAVNIMHSHIQEVKHTMKAARLLYSAPQFILYGPIYMVCVITIGSVVYSCIGKVKENVTCPMELTKDTTDIQSPAAGIVSQVFIKEGDEVSPFTSLVDIQIKLLATSRTETEKLKEQLEQLQRDKQWKSKDKRDLDKRKEDLERDLKALKGTEGKLDERIQKEKNDFQTRVEDSSRAVKSVEVLLGQTETNVKDAENNLSNRRESHTKAVERHKENQGLFDKKMITKIELDGTRDTMDNSKEALDNAQTALNRAKGEVTKVQLQLEEAKGGPNRLQNQMKSLEYGWNLERSNIRSRISELEFELQRMHTQEARTEDQLDRDIADVQDNLRKSGKLLPGVVFQGDQCTIHSTFGGRVTNVYIKPGQQIAAGEVMFRIIRGTEVMYARVLVENWDIGRLKEDHLVKLKYYAFPYQEYGIKEGRINKIPTTPSTVKGQESKYEVKVRLMEDEREIEGVKVKIPPGKILVGKKQVELNLGLLGMADIEVRDKLVIEMIFTPLSKFLSQE